MEPRREILRLQVPPMTSMSMEKLVSLGGRVFLGMESSQRTGLEVLWDDMDRFSKTSCGRAVMREGCEALIGDGGNCVDIKINVYNESTEQAEVTLYVRKWDEASHIVDSILEGRAWQAT